MTATEGFAKLFIDKSHHRKILVEAIDSMEGSRIGGRPGAGRPMQSRT